MSGHPMSLIFRNYRVIVFMLCHVLYPCPCFNGPNLSFFINTLSMLWSSTIEFSVFKCEIGHPTFYLFKLLWSEVYVLVSCFCRCYTLLILLTFVSWQAVKITKPLEISMYEILQLRVA